ncbi:MAG: MerR family transcriptional regulator [Dermatophilaceae bacterium]
MSTSLTIGEFSRLTHLGVKALRHYHDIELLVPTAVDPASGYRLYSTEQVAAAHVIRRFRDLDMPLKEIRIVLDAPDPVTRNRAVMAHLDRLERTLDQTHAAVESLRSLLTDPAAPLSVEVRNIPAQRAYAITESVRRRDIDQWCAEVFPELYEVVAQGELVPRGPSGGLYSDDFFTQGAAEVSAFVPTNGVGTPGGRVQCIEVPAARVAAALHIGAFSELDRTYGALGAHVAERSLGSAGPIREHYLVTPADTADPARLRTEVCWPINSTQPLEGVRP